MALKLSWKNPNTVPNSIVIYRGDAPLNPSSLPTPLVELKGGELSWIDQTAVFERTYYYILGVKTDNDLILTPNQKVVVADSRGVGPSTLVFGNDALGYYGSVNQGDFLSNLDIVAAGAKQTGLPTTPVQITWHKFAREGKVLYVPNKIFGVVKWVDLYNAGFVFGVDDVKHDETTPMAGLTPTNQLRIIEFKGQRYKVRLMRAWGDGKDGEIADWGAGNTESLNIPRNEFSDLIYSICEFVPGKQRIPNAADYTWSSMVGAELPYYNPPTGQETGWILCQERKSDNGYVMTRGERSWNSSATVSHHVSHLTKQTPKPHDSPFGWIPVLELVQENNLVI